jgi:hypothetical protein
MKDMETMSRKPSQNLKARGLFYFYLYVIVTTVLFLISYVDLDHTNMVTEPCEG